MIRRTFLRSLLILVWVLTACTTPPLNADVPVLESDVDPDDWATVPAGSFLKGQHAHETLLSYEYEIMVTDVTNTQYADFLNGALGAGEIRLGEDAVVGYYPGDPFHGQHHEKEITAGEWRFVPLNASVLRLSVEDGKFAALPGYEHHPMTMVSWFGAWGYCRFYGWRLPTDVEWEKAARGVEDDRPFPWGYAIENDHANFLNSADPFERVFEGAGGTTPVGFYNGTIHDGYATRDGASPYGLYDMGGNVWQWTGDVHVGVHYRSLRGGSYTTYPYNLRIWTPNNADPVHVSPDVGFRCARGGD